MDRTPPSKPATHRKHVLDEPVLTGRWPCNRRGEECRVVLKTYEGHALVDVRRWYPQGDEFRPGKGCSLTIANLSALKKAIDAAHARATELGLIEASAAKGAP